MALKQVSQEFSQGNIQFSANSLDIAITGDGFPIKSPDGLPTSSPEMEHSYLMILAVVNSAEQFLRLQRLTVMERQI